MSSGCIMGECPICGELIWEDEWDMTDDIMHHEDCKITKYVAQFAKLPIAVQKLVFDYLNLEGKS